MEKNYKLNLKIDATSKIMNFNELCKSDRKGEKNIVATEVSYQSEKIDKKIVKTKQIKKK